jgi:hypothetical protein
VMAKVISVEPIRYEIQEEEDGVYTLYSRVATDFGGDAVNYIAGGTYAELTRLKKTLIDNDKDSKENMNLKNRFDLEQEILECWGITTDIDNLYNLIGDDKFFEGMDPKHQDKIMNVLLGMKELYEIKFDKCFKTFEVCARTSDI